jgi:tRNA pseudouridine13 synthase
MAVQEDDIGLYKEARDHWSASKNVKETLDLFPKRSLAERSILKSYLVDAEGHLAAVSAIPRNLRLMYVHAYQSLVFNYMVSERIEKYGNELVVGDLVLVENAKDDAQLEGLGVIDDDVIGDAINNRRETKQIVKIVQESDLNNYTIYDVVLPLPGHSVTYPSNSIGESYKSFMLKDGFDPDNMKRALKFFLFIIGILVWPGRIGRLSTDLRDFPGNF